MPDQTSYPPDSPAPPSRDVQPLASDVFRAAVAPPKRRTHEQTQLPEQPDIQRALRRLRPSIQKTREAIREALPAIRRDPDRLDWSDLPHGKAIHVAHSLGIDPRRIPRRPQDQTSLEPPSSGGRTTSASAKRSRRPDP